MPIKSLLLSAPILVTLASQASAAELLTNGDMENFSTPVFPSAWNFSPEPGGGQSPVNSPFTSIYAAGASSLLMADAPGVNLTPSLTQNFTPQTAISFAVDFHLNALSGSEWDYVVEGNTPSFGFVSAFVFQIDNINYGFLANGVPLFTPSANVWYHLEGTADIATHLLNGSVTPFGGAAIPFSNVPFNSFTTDLRNVGIYDSFMQGTNNYRNGDLLVDNFSITALPEPASLAILTPAAFPLLARRRAKQSP